MPNGVPPLLDGFSVRARGDFGLSGRICAEHLALLGARWEPADVGCPPGVAAEMELQPGPGLETRTTGRSVNCTILWGPLTSSDPDRTGSEALVQAISGLMGLNGRDQGSPRRLGLDVASVAAGIVASQGVLAALIAGSRGGSIHWVETSVLNAALLLLSHHLAIATTREGLGIIPGQAGLGPPFLTADGHWIEIEALSFGGWISFWTQLGANRGELESAWSAFAYRYLTAVCRLPPSLHEAASRHSFAEIHRAGLVCGVAVCRLRSYPELLAELQRTGDGRSRSAAPSLKLEPPWQIRPGNEVSVRPDHRPFAAGAPLNGFRVVEVTSRLQGPLAGLLLGMLGAEVVKVEPPGGDFGRYAPPLAGSEGAAYLAYNRGKHVVEIDYKRPEGRAQLIDLATGADVFLHNWRSGRAEKLELDFDNLAVHNPRLVYAHASGWGRTAEEPCPIAGDFLVQAYAGCSDGLSPVDELARPSRVTMVDPIGGLLACEGILAGLYLRERSGRGCRVDTSLLGGAMALQRHVLQAIVCQEERGRNLGRPVWGQLDRPLETGSGWLVVELEDEVARMRLMEVCGLGPYAEVTSLLERLRTRSAVSWEGFLRNAGVRAAAVRTDLASVPFDDRVVGLLEPIEGDCWMPAAPWHLEA